MHTGIEFLERLMNGCIDRELVAAGMDAEFQVDGQAVFPNATRSGDVAGKLIAEFRQIANIIHSFIEAAGELGAMVEFGSLHRQWQQG